MRNMVCPQIEPYNPILVRRLSDNVKFNEDELTSLHPRGFPYQEISQS
jgi:hypothetical protein